MSAAAWMAKVDLPALGVPPRMFSPCRPPSAWSSRAKPVVRPAQPAPASCANRSVKVWNSPAGEGKGEKARASRTMANTRCWNPSGCSVARLCRLALFGALSGQRTIRTLKPARVAKTRARAADSALWPTHRKRVRIHSNRRGSRCSRSAAAGTATPGRPSCLRQSRFSSPSTTNSVPFSQRSISGALNSRYGSAKNRSSPYQNASSGRSGWTQRAA